MQLSVQQQMTSLPKFRQPLRELGYVEAGAVFRAIGKEVASIRIR